MGNQKCVCEEPLTAECARRELVKWYTIYVGIGNRFALLPFKSYKPAPSAWGDIGSATSENSHSIITGTSPDETDLDVTACHCANFQCPQKQRLKNSSSWRAHNQDFNESLGTLFDR